MLQKKMTAKSWGQYGNLQLTAPTCMTADRKLTEIPRILIVVDFAQMLGD